MTPLILALIGTGRWGANIRRTLSGLPGCASQYTETRNWRRLLRLPDLDGVLVATPASTHAAIARPFIERGVPTFVEKPLATSLRDARNLERAAKRSGTPVFVGHVHLYNPAYLAAKRAARRAGRVRYILGEGMNNGPFRDDVSCLWDWAPHDLAMALDLLGTKPATVSASAASVLRPGTKLSDIGSLHVRFPRNVHLFGLYSWLAPTKRKRLTIVGERDTVVYDDTATRKVTVYRGLGPRVRGNRVIRQEPVVTHPAYSPDLPLTRELAAFLRCVRTRKPPRTGITEGLAVVRILAAAEQSLRRGSTVVKIASR